MTTKTSKHGGARKGAGRPPAQDKMRRRSIGMLKVDWQEARVLSDNADVSVDELLRRLVRAATANNCLASRPERRNMLVKYHVEMRYLDKRDQEHRAVADVYAEHDATSDTVKELAEKKAGVDKKAYSGHAYDTLMSKG